MLSQKHVTLIRYLVYSEVQAHKIIHTRHHSYSTSKQNILSSSSTFSLLYSSLPHPSFIISLLHPNYPYRDPHVTLSPSFLFLSPFRFILAFSLLPLHPSPASPGSQPLLAGGAPHLPPPSLPAAETVSPAPLPGGGRCPTYRRSERRQRRRACPRRRIERQRRPPRTGEVETAAARRSRGFQR
jgi:hypothetical protein